jgi:hypothetical protein
MANTTFTGPVRSEGGFQVVSKNSTTGAYTDIATIASTGIVTDKYVKHVGFATGVTVNTTAGDSPTIGEFTQPANTIITNIKIFCDTAPVIGTGDIGYEVGTSSSGAQIVAAIADEILDGGTTVVVGNVTTTTLVATTQNAATALSLLSMLQQSVQFTVMLLTQWMLRQRVRLRSSLSTFKLPNNHFGWELRLPPITIGD